MEVSRLSNRVLQHDRTHFILLTLLSLLILFVSLHRGDLSGYDDAYYAHEAKEMIRSGDWWNIRFNGEPNFTNPPMFLWLEVLSMTLFGVNDFAAKAPSALAGLGTIVTVYFLARELTDDPWMPRMAMLVMMSTQCFVKYSRHAMTDVPFTFFLSLSILFYLKGLRVPRYLVLAGLPVACAILTRSVIGMIPIGIIFVHLLATRRSDLLLSRYSTLFLLTAFSLPAAWIAVNYQLYGIQFVEGHLGFVASNVQGGESIQSPSPIQRLSVFPKLLLTTYWPWLPFMVVGFYQYSRAVISRRNPGAMWVLAWALCAILPYSVARAPYSRYFLPAFPALAILSATALDCWMTPRRKPVLFNVSYALGAVMVICTAVMPMTLLRATDMRRMAPVADAHTPPQERVLLYTFGVSNWALRNQLLWYGNRRTQLVTDLSEVRSSLVSGEYTVAVVDADAANNLVADLHAENGPEVTRLAESEKFVCLKRVAALR